MHRHGVWASDDTIQTRYGCAMGTGGSGAGSSKKEVSSGVGSIRSSSAEKGVWPAGPASTLSLEGAPGPVVGLD